MPDSAAVREAREALFRTHLGPRAAARTLRDFPPGGGRLSLAQGEL